MTWKLTCIPIFLNAGLSEFEIYICNNGTSSPTLGSPIVRARGWTLRGADLLMQTRTKTLNKELEDVFRPRYPQFRERDKAAAA